MKYMQCLVVSATNDERKPIRCRRLTAVFSPWFGVFGLFAAGFLFIEFLTCLQGFTEVKLEKMQLDFVLGEP